jgi:hypothetical protein
VEEEPAEEEKEESSGGGVLSGIWNKIVGSSENPAALPAASSEVGSEYVSPGNSRDYALIRRKRQRWIDRTMQS